MTQMRTEIKSRAMIRRFLDIRVIYPTGSQRYLYRFCLFSVRNYLKEDNSPASIAIKPRHGIY
jgi:hypothetical protein